MAPAEGARSAGARPSPPPPPPTPAPRPRPPARVLLLAAALALALALAHAPAAHAQSCDPDADATYTAAVLEYSPALGVTLENAAERFRQNVQNYVAYAKEAKRQGAEIVVFPECGLATLELPRLPDSSPAVALPLPPLGANPCVETDAPHAQELRDLSCAARDAAIYVVVNLPEVERCLPALAFCPECPGFQPRAVRSGVVACNTDGRRYFNSDVAFDRKGTIVARYRKYNLFGEAGFVPPAEPSLAHFDADFGVRFGLFTCFDLMFEQPAVTLVTEAGVSDVLFPTAWFSELPFLTAVQAQAAWAWVLDVNFLGAGYNLPEVGSTGTGLYAGRRGKVVATMERDRTNKLLVGRLPNRNACSHNATAAEHLAGKIVVLARKADPPPPPPPSATPPPPPAAKCVSSLPPTNPKIPSLYQCHLQSLLQLKDGRRLINPETGEEAEEPAEGVRYELYYQREAEDDEAEVRADEDEFREAVAPRRAGDAALLHGPRFRRYLQDVMLRGLRRLHDKEPGAGAAEAVEAVEEEEAAAAAVDVDQLKAEVERLLLPPAEDAEKKLPSLGDTVDAMRKNLEGMVGKHGMQAEGEQYDYLLHQHEEEEERDKLHKMETPPLNDTLETMGTQFDEMGDHTAALMLHEVMEDELLREKEELQEARRKAVEKCKQLHGFDKPCLEHLKAEGLSAEVETNDATEGRAEDVEGGAVGGSEFEELQVEELPPEGERPAEEKAEVELEDLRVEELELPEATAEGAWSPTDAALHCQCVRRADSLTPLPPAGEPLGEAEGAREGEAAPGAGAGVGGGGGGVVGADGGGYLYLKTEDLTEYVTVLLPAAAPDPVAYENSSLKVCHDSFCCHFQVVMSVQQGEGAGEGAGEGEGEGAGEGRADEPPFAAGQDTEGVGFVRAARRGPVGGALARHFIIPEGEEEDYLEDDEDDEGGGDGDDDDDEDEAFAPAPEEMEPTEDEFDDDEEVQMDTSAEFAMDPVLLKASGIGHYGPGQVFKETVEREDMEPSEDTIRAQAKADEKEAAELREMQAHMPAHAPEAPAEPEAAAPEAAPSREDQRYYYRVAVFNGRRTFDGITDGGLQVCAVIPCTGVTPDTCGKLHHFPSDLALTTFRHVRISGRFARVRSLPLPSTLDAALLPLPAHAFSLSASVRRKETDIVMETHKPVNFLTFGIYNRNFANDPERQPSIG